MPAASWASSEKVGLSGDDAPETTVFRISDSFDDQTVKVLESAAAGPLDYEARWALGEHEDRGACFILAVNLAGEVVMRLAFGVPADEETRRTLIGHLVRADRRPYAPGTCA